VSVTEKLNSFSGYRVQTGSDVNPASYPMGKRRLFLGVKWPEREADRPPQ